MYITIPKKCKIVNVNVVISIHKKTRFSCDYVTNVVTFSIIKSFFDLNWINFNRSPYIINLKKMFLRFEISDKKQLIPRKLIVSIPVWLEASIIVSKQMMHGGLQVILCAKGYTVHFTCFWQVTTWFFSLDSCHEFI